jgi:imidazolonepropionase-like amidohydrolase
MRTRFFQLLIAIGLVPVFVVTSVAQTQRVTIRAASAFDGRGRTITNATIVVANGKIADVTTSATAAPTYDLRG